MNDDRWAQVRRNPEYVKFGVLLIVTLVALLLLALLAPPIVEGPFSRALGLSGDRMPAAQEFIPFVTGRDAPAAPRTHTVAEGETLPQIAAQYDVSLEYLAAANNVINPYELKPGTILVIPE
jgi:nucleoid-associated protein YgaU